MYKGLVIWVGKWQAYRRSIQGGPTKGGALARITKKTILVASGVEAAYRQVTPQMDSYSRDAKDGKRLDRLLPGGQPHASTSCTQHHV